MLRLHRSCNLVIKANQGCVGKSYSTCTQTGTHADEQYIFSTAKGICRQTPIPTSLKNIAHCRGEY